MKAKGYTCIHSMERTVAFTFGEFTFRRRRWKKGEHWVIPVDEKLGLQKNVRFSWEFMYQVAKLSTLMPYDKVTQVIQLTYHISITKPIVVKAVKICEKLLEEREGYRYYEENKEVSKRKAQVITGSQKVGSNRFELQDKKEFIGLDNRLVREQVIDYLFNNYEVTDQTLLITNSDGGHGYTPYVFKEIAKVLRIKRHEHFWDEYHVNKELKNYLKFYSEDLLERAFQAIKQHDKQLMRTVLDTTESYIETEEEQELFEKFKSKILRNFQYTKPAEQRGFSHAGIGIMESQHRKVTYRMKKRGMYWTLAGAETMSRIIVLNYEDSLRELFFGNWREDYEKFISLEEISAYTIKKRMSKMDKENTSRYQCYPDSKRLSYFRKQ